MGPPHLKAMIPWEGTSDLYREWYFHGGIPETAFSSNFEELNRSRWPNNEIEPMIEEQAEHPLLDDFWKAKEVNLSNIQVPMFVCASWSTQGLHCRGTFEGFKSCGQGFCRTGAGTCGSWRSIGRGNKTGDDRILPAL